MDLKKKLKAVLDQSGMTDRIRSLASDIIKTSVDLENLTPDDIARQIFDKGLLDDALEKLVQNESSPTSIHRERKENLENKHLASAKSQYLTRIVFRAEGLKTMSSESDCGENAIEKSFVEEQPMRNVKQSNGSISREMSEFEMKKKIIREGRYKLVIEIDGGKGFMVPETMDKSSQQYFVVHVIYRGKRISSCPVPTDVNPTFRLNFASDLTTFYADASCQDICRVKHPVDILLTLGDVFGKKRLLLSHAKFDWRWVLREDDLNYKSKFEMKGVGERHDFLVGALNLGVSVEPEIKNVKIHHIEDLLEEELEMLNHKKYLFYERAKGWWRDCMEAHPQFINSVECSIFVYDENMTVRVISSYIQKIKVDRIFHHPLQALRFVSLMNLTRSRDIISSEENNELVYNKYWQSVSATLASRSGTFEDLSNILCSLLIGFQLNAFVAIGHKKYGVPYAWVVVLNDTGGPTFWDALSGKCSFHFPKDKGETPLEKLNRFKRNEKSHEFISINILFNQDFIYCNIQAVSSIHDTDWDLQNVSKWKCLCCQDDPSSEQIPEMLPNHIFQQKDVTKTSTLMETELALYVEEVRKASKLTTNWDPNLSSLLESHLTTSEWEQLTGKMDDHNLFQEAILKYLKPGYDFKGFPYSCNHLEVKDMFIECMRDPKCQEIVMLRGNNVKFANRVQIYPQPEDLVCVRLMIACTYIPTTE